MDTAEMYERGVADAYRGVPNPTYYHQFEPYRRAYDQTRVHMRKTGTVPIVDVRRVGLNVLFVVAVAVIAVGIYYFTTTGPPPAAFLRFSSRLRAPSLNSTISVVWRL